MNHVRLLMVMVDANSGVLLRLRLVVMKYNNTL
jgi:hypothetical protein